MTKLDAGGVEWIVGAVSAGVVALTLGFLTLHAVRSAEAAPDLAIARERPEEPGAAQLRFVVSNAGERPARDVTVALRLRGNPGDKRTLTIDFVPANSQVAGAFLLEGDARTPDYDLRVESYLDP